MSVWAWVAIGVTALIGVPILVGLAIARILGAIADDLSRVMDEDRWTTAPLKRATERHDEESAAPTREQEERVTPARKPRR